MGYIDLPQANGGGGSATWQEAVADVASLPVGGNTSGDCRVVLDLMAIYSWDGGAWVATDPSTFGQVLYVSNVSGGRFTSIAAAITAASGIATVNTPVVIIVGPGQYIEPVLIVPSYVSIKGESSAAVTVIPDGFHNVFEVVSDSTAISRLAIFGAPATKAGISAINFGTTMTVSDVVFASCDTAIKLETQVAGVASIALIDGCIVSDAVDVGISITGYGVALNAVITNTQFSAGAVTPATSFYNVIGTTAGITVAGGAAVNFAAPTTGTCFIVQDGAQLALRDFVSSYVGAFISNPNVGDPCEINVLSSYVSYAVLPIDIQHIGTTGAIGCTCDTTLNNILADGISMLLQDETNNAVLMTGALQVGNKYSEVTDIQPLLQWQSASGVLVGGVLSVSGLDVSVAVGSGYVKVGTHPTDYLKYVSFSADTITLPVSSYRYLYVDASGVFTADVSKPDFTQNIFLGEVQTNASTTLVLKKDGVIVDSGITKVDDYLRNAIGSIYESGSITTESATDRQLDVSSGVYYYSMNKYTPTGGADISFRQIYSDGGAGWTISAAQTLMAATSATWKYDDGSGTLANIPATDFAKYSLYLSGDSSEEKYFLGTPTATFAALVDAEAADIPTVPTFIGQSVVLIAAIVVQQGQANITEILDNRPVIGFQAAGVSASATHGNLLGLTADDHLQYVRTDGTRVMTGALQVGTASNQLAVGTGVNKLTINGATSAAARTYSVPDVGVTSNFVMDQGAQTVAGAKTFSTAVAINAGSNQVELSTGVNKLTLNSSTSAAARTYVVPDVGAASDFVMTQGTQTVVGAKTFGAVSIGTSVTLSGGAVAAAASLTPDLANSAGVATSLTRSDHIHNLLTAAAVTLDSASTNTQGAAASFARSDHTHEITSAAPIQVNADGANDAGVAAGFSKADHKHDIAASVAASAQTPDQAGGAGSSSSLSRADHVHNIATAAASGLTAASTNTQGAAATFNRADHTHAIASGAASAQTPDQANATGSSSNFARADHVHNILTAAASSLSATTTNTQGAAASFARSDHTHAIDSAAASTISTSGSNATGTATTFSRSDHTHLVTVTSAAVTSVALLTTTSATDVLLTGMTTTPAAGTYFVSASTTVGATSNSRSVFMSIYSGGVQVGSSESFFFVRAGGAAISTNDCGVLHGTAIVTVNGAEAIEMRWRTSGGTAQAQPSAMNLLRIS